MSAVTMIERLSPNHNARSAPIRCIVLHADAGPNEEATLSWTDNPESQVSYHVLAGRDGRLYRIVPDERRAWAVGYAAWKGVRNVNSVSLSIAFANRQDGKELLTAPQIASVKQVIAEWRAKWQIEEVTTHKIVSRYKDGAILHNGQPRKHDPETAPNFALAEYL